MAKTQSEKFTFFMRFYGQTEENIQKVVDKVIERHPKGKFLGVFDAVSAGSLGGVEYLKRREVKESKIEFPNKKEYTKAFKDEECQKLYLSLCAPKEKVEGFLEIGEGSIEFKENSFD